MKNFLSYLSCLQVSSSKDFNQYLQMNHEKRREDPVLQIDNPGQWFLVTLLIGFHLYCVKTQDSLETRCQFTGVPNEPQQCRSDTGRHPSNLCGVSINIVMYHIREGVKKMYFFWEISPKCVYPPTHPRVFVRFGRTKGEIRV